MTKGATGLKNDLRRLGYSQQAIDAVWPAWWSDAAADSKSAEVELRFSVARRLGLSPKSLLSEAGPTFIWKHDAKFKGLSQYGGTEQTALTSFGIALARSLLKAISAQTKQNIESVSAEDVRAAILKHSQFVTLSDLCATCWGLGIPVVHLRVFPMSAKNMVAMAVKSGSRVAILVGKDASYPAPTAYHIAHEMGHIAKGHLASSIAIVDLDEPIEVKSRDSEEQEADSFAMELLTGIAKPVIESTASARNGLELASAVNAAAKAHRIEPGTLALCYGHQTGDWKTSYAALSRIYDQKYDVWRFINKLAITQLDWEQFSEEEAAYVRAVLGAADLA